ncbi:MAG: pentapeptide repeat-containing protein [Bacteroidaceae bacterium]|nr:pentapeptide repeat-containing protein [Bacteroidaceae bacterium]
MENCNEFQAKLSFIDEENIEFKTVDSLEDLKIVVATCRNSNEKKLSKYNFSNLEEISCICFDGVTLEDVVFSRFCPCRNKRPLLFQLSFKGAILNRVSFAHADLQQCNFDSARIDYVDFFFSRIKYSRFRQSVAHYVDFRYSQINNCTLGEMDVTMGDFYFCNFLGSTNFIKSKFTNCSFTNAIFEHACIRMDNIEGGIIQEHSAAYHGDFLYKEELHWNRYNPCFSFSSMNPHSRDSIIKSDAFIASESMNFYKQMSGIYAGKGLNRDSNQAYKKKVLEERKYCKKKLIVLKQEGYSNCDGESIWHYRSKYYKTFLTQAMGYGYKWWTPCVWFFALVIVFWIIFQLVDGIACIDTPDWLQHLGYSFNNALSPFEDYYRVVNIFISSLQSTLGILLVGFLGFVIANKIRNDS